jgi:hypothetical protein
MKLDRSTVRSWGENTDMSDAPVEPAFVLIDGALHVHMKHPAAKGCTDDGTLAIVPIYIYTRSCTPFGRLSPLLAVACRRSALLF